MRHGWILTESDARVVLAHLLALLIGEEHVGGQTTLGRVGVCAVSMEGEGDRMLTLLALFGATGLGGGLAGSLLLRHFD